MDDSMFLIFNKYKDLVGQIYNKKFRKFAFFREDLFQEGFLGLLNAIQNGSGTEPSEGIIRVQIYSAMQSFINKEMQHREYCESIKEGREYNEM